MKRYKREFEGYDIRGRRCYAMLATTDGNYVEYEDVQKIKQDKTRALFRNSELVMENSRLKELNREMVEALTMVYKSYHNDMSICDLTQVYDAIAKAEGREPIIKEEGE